MALALRVPAAAAADTGWHLAGAYKAPAPRFELGTGTTPGMTASQAVYVRKQDGANGIRLLEKTFDARAWRGHRVRVTLHLKNEGGPIASAAVQVNRSGGSVVRTVPQSSLGRGDGWQTREFVMDVTNDATALAIHLNVVGDGTGWIDSVTLKAVGTDVPLSRNRRGIDIGWMNSVDTSRIGGGTYFPFTPGPGDPYNPPRYDPNSPPPT